MEIDGNWWQVRLRCSPGESAQLRLLPQKEKTPTDPQKTLTRWNAWTERFHRLHFLWVDKSAAAWGQERGRAGCSRPLIIRNELWCRTLSSLDLHSFIQSLTDPSITSTFYIIEISSVCVCGVPSFHQCLILFYLSCRPVVNGYFTLVWTADIILFSSQVQSVVSETLCAPQRRMNRCSWLCNLWEVMHEIPKK